MRDLRLNFQGLLSIFQFPEETEKGSAVDSGSFYSGVNGGPPFNESFLIIALFFASYATG
jgi:hypothetical protein